MASEVICKRNRENLDCDVWIGGAGFNLAQVDRLVDVAHATFANLFQQPEAVEQHTAAAQTGGTRLRVETHFRGVEQDGRRMRDLRLEERVELRKTGPGHRKLASNDLAMPMMLTSIPAHS